MAAAAWRRPAPVYMFNRYADMSQITGEPGEGWAKMECNSKNAYGCGENIQEAVHGLALYVRLGADPVVTSSLAIRMTDEALRRFTKELELDISPLFRGRLLETTAWAQILMHAEDLTIITLRLERGCYHILGYTLVYDHKRASLSIIQPVEAPAVQYPVPKRTCNGDYELFYMALDSVNEIPFAALDTERVLYVFSPGRAEANPAASAWEMRRKRRCSVPVSVEERFKTDLTLSFQGKGFWVDLSQGLEYCDLQDTATAGDDSVVDLSYIELPRECVLTMEMVMHLHLQEPMEATRTMGCDRDSIWFVCIQRFSDNWADNLVSMWTLKLNGRKEQWKNEAKFSLRVRDFWRFDGFKEAGLPEAPMWYPLLNAEDGVLYLLLSGYIDAEIGWVDHICSFDVRNKKLLWHGIVHNHNITKPAALPSHFFQTERLHDAAAGLASLLQPVLRSTTTLLKQKKIIYPGSMNA